MYCWCNISESMIVSSVEQEDERLPALWLEMRVDWELMMKRYTDVGGNSTKRSREEAGSIQNLWWLQLRKTWNVVSSEKLLILKNLLREFLCECTYLFSVCYRFRQQWRWTVGGSEPSQPQSAACQTTIPAFCGPDLSRSWLGQPWARRRR
jgi:hypothetical protein